jgi:DNA-binding NarL/FixJ family response regulator
MLRAQAARAAGTVLLAQGDARSALVELRTAFNHFDALDARFDAASTRQLLAEACQALGDLDAAAMESTAPRATIESLRGAVQTIGTEPERQRAHGLTEREREVLVLVACGNSNRAIADQLVISEKTVTSHISHIFTKLGVTSRSAATAYAYDHGLARPHGD